MPGTNLKALETALQIAEDFLSCKEGETVELNFEDETIIFKRVPPGVKPKRIKEIQHDRNQKNIFDY